MYDTYLNHARELYEQAVNAEYKTRRRLLREALTIISAVPNDAEGRAELAARLENALQGD